MGRHPSHIVKDKYNRLTPLEFVGEKISPKTKVLCKCDCGKKHTTTFTNLHYEHSKSCGCLIKENLRNYNEDRFIRVKCLTTGKIYENIREAAEANNISQSGLLVALSKFGRIKNLQFKKLTEVEWLEEKISNCTKRGLTVDAIVQ